MKKIRVAVVNEGAAADMRRHIVDIQRRMDSDRFQITVILSTRKEFETEGDPAADLRASGISCMEVPMVHDISPLNDWKSLHRFKKILTLERFDVVHAHAVKAGFLARYACRGALPCIYSPHVFAFQRSSRIASIINREAERLAIGWTTAFLVASDEEKRHALKLGASPDAVHVIRNAVDLAIPISKERALQLRKSIGTSDNSVVYLTSGRLVAYKGHHTLIRAFAEAASSLENLELWIAGEGKERTKLEALASKYCHAKIRFLGYRTDLGDLLCASDCFVINSRAESCPSALLEALAHEKPIIATRVPGNIELLLQNPPHARLIPWNDEKALVLAISEYSETPFPGAPLASLPSDWFDVPGQVKKIAQLYETVAKIRPA